MKSKIFVVLVLLALVATMFVACNNASDYSEVVKNGTFEAMDGTNVQGWTKSTGSSIVFKTDNDKQSDQYDPQLGTRYASIEKNSSSAAYDYLFQKVKLEKNQLYRLSVYAKVSAIQTNGKSGFYVGFAEDLNYSGILVKEVYSSYKTYEVYFRSTVSGELTLTVGLGNTKDKAYGTVSFDNVSLTPVDSVPSEYTAGVKVLRTSADYTLSNAGSTAFVVIFAILSVAIVFAAYMLLRKFTKPVSDFDPEKGSKKPLSNKAFLLFVGAIAAGFVIRFLITLLSYGMGSEINELGTLAAYCAKNGVTAVFTDSSLSNQPAGVIYILWILGEIANALGVEAGSMGMSVLVRIPVLLADLIVCYTIFSFAYHEREDEKSALVFVWLYAVLPVFFVFSSLFGSYEAVAAMFLVLTVICMLDKNYAACGIFYVFALLFSHYALIVLPVILVFEIVSILKESDIAANKDGSYEAAQVKEAKNNRLYIILTMVGGFVLYYLAALPMSLSNIKQGNVLFVFKQAYAFFKTQGLLSTDAMGLYTMFGLANEGTRNTLLEVCNWLFVAGMGIFAAVCYYKSRNRADLILISSAMLALYAILGAQSTVVVLPIAVLLLLLYTIIVSDKRLVFVTGGFALLSFLNIAELVSRSGYIGDYLQASYLAFYSKSAFLIVFSIFAVLLAFYFAYVVTDICIYGRVNEVQPIKGSMAEELKKYATFTRTREYIAKKRK